MREHVRTQPQLMTIGEVAELLRTPESTLRWWRHKGFGPPSFRLGRRVLYDRGDVEAYIADRRSAAGCETRAAA